MWWVDWWMHVLALVRGGSHPFRLSLQLILHGLRLMTSMTTRLPCFSLLDTRCLYLFWTAWWLSSGFGFGSGLALVCAGVLGYGMLFFFFFQQEMNDAFFFSCLDCVSSIDIITCLCTCSLHKSILAFISLGITAEVNLGISTASHLRSSSGASSFITSSLLHFFDIFLSHSDSSLSLSIFQNLIHHVCLIQDPPNCPAICQRQGQKDPRSGTTPLSIVTILS